MSFKDKKPPKVSRDYVSLPKHGEGGELTWLRNFAVDTFALSNGTMGRWESLLGGKTTFFLGITEEGQLILTHLWRFPASGFFWELPGGCVEDGEDVATASKREFLEETGYSPCGEVLFLCEGVFWNGRSDAHCAIYFCGNCRRMQQVSLDPVEEVMQLTVETVSLTDLKALLLEQSGGNVDPVLSHAIMQAQLKGFLKFF